MHSKPQKRTVERLTCRESWKSCLPAKTKARARMRPQFLQPSCALRSRFEAHSSRSHSPDSNMAPQLSLVEARAVGITAAEARELWLWFVALFFLPGCLAHLIMLRFADAFFE